uniref:Uncharacterized protein n=2 Tax=Aegilops tauschii subsp. strangulata TaxID=200361 RepID=A0A453K0Q9_AEGTS
GPLLCRRECEPDGYPSLPRTSPTRPTSPPRLSPAHIHAARRKPHSLPSRCPSPSASSLCNIAFPRGRTTLPPHEPPRSSTTRSPPPLTGEAMVL